MMLFRRIALLCLTLPLHAAVDDWDLPPVHYSDTPARDRLAAFAPLPFLLKKPNLGSRGAPPPVE